MKTAELTGAMLDLAVARAQGRHAELSSEMIPPVVAMVQRADGGFDVFEPSTDWRTGGEIIERERIELWPAEKNWTAYIAVKPHRNIRQYGPTPLIAAMRAYVASRT